MTDLTINAKASGRIKVKIIRGETGLVEELDFNNMLLNKFFEDDANSISACVVGTDTSVSAVDTTINSIGSSIDIASSNTGYTVNVTEISIGLKTIFTLGIGAVTGNASSIGLYSSVNINPVYLIIKTLIKDLNGDPTTISLGATDQLIITHTLTLKIDQKPAPFILNVDGTNHSFQFFSGKLETFTSARTSSSSPFLFHYNTAGVYNGAVVIASSYSMLADGDFTSNIPLGSMIVLSTTSTDDQSESSLGKFNSLLVGTASGVDNFSGDAPIAFVGWAQKNSPNGRSYGGFGVTPPLPKNSGIGYKFTIKIVMQR